jgi:DNA-binding transcriptional MerR regulator
MSNVFTVGQVARRLDVSPKAIRYYEDIGLLPPVARFANGYRRYDSDDVNRLRFIVRAKSIGLTLRKIRDLVAAAEQGECNRITAHLKNMLDSKIEECDLQIKSLIEFRARLEELSGAVRVADGGQSSHGSGHPPFSPECTCLPAAG